MNTSTVLNNIYLIQPGCSFLLAVFGAYQLSLVLQCQTYLIPWLKYQKMYASNHVNIWVFFTQLHGFSQYISKYFRFVSRNVLFSGQLFQCIMVPILHHNILEVLSCKKDSQEKEKENAKECHMLHS